MVYRDSKLHFSAGSLFFFFWLSLSLVVWSRLGDLFLSQNSREVCVSHSPGPILGWANTTYSYGEIKIFAHFPLDHPSHPVVSSLIIFFVLVCCICLLCDWSFFLYHHNLHLLSCCVLSIFALIWLVLLFTPLEFFTSVLANGFSLEFEWQQVSSSLQDSSQYSGRSQ